MWLDQIFTHKVKARPKNAERRGARAFLHLLPPSSAGRIVRLAGSQFTNGLRQKERRQREIGSAARVAEALAKCPWAASPYSFFSALLAWPLTSPLITPHTRGTLEPRLASRPLRRSFGSNELLVVRQPSCFLGSTKAHAQASLVFPLHHACTPPPPPPQAHAHRHTHKHARRRPAPTPLGARGWQASQPSPFFLPPVPPLPV